MNKQEELQSEYDKLIKRLDRCLDTIPGCCTPDYDFSDEQIQKAAETIYFPERVINRGEIKKVLTRFFNFYTSGTVSLRHSAFAVVLDMVANTYVGKYRLWPDERFAPEGFYMPCSSTSEEINNVDPGEFVGMVYSDAGWGQLEQSQYDTLMNTYNSASALKFKGSLQNRISRINVDQDITKEERVLRSMGGFLALSLLRFATKNQNQMGNAYRQKQFLANIVALTGWRSELGFSPPCKSCLETCQTEFANGAIGVSSIFTLLTDKHMQLCKTTLDPINNEMLKFISASVMNQTAKNGLGLLTLLAKSCHILKIEWENLMSLTHFSNTAATWIKIRDFHLRYLSKESLSRGFYWARIINHGYLRGLSPKDCPFLAAIFATIVESSEGSSVWDAEWCRFIQRDRDAAIAIGKAVLSITSTERENMKAHKKPTCMTD